MPCPFPILVSPAKDDPIQAKWPVPCGRCKWCRVNRKLSWIGRMRLELAAHGGVGRFVTLTYADDEKANAPIDPRDLTLWLKRYRKRHGKFRYFAVGEYGSKSGRAHFHAIIFGHAQRYKGPADPRDLCWHHGHCFDGYAHSHSISYVAGYVLKPAPSGRPNPITRMSRMPGLGAVSLEALAVKLAESFSDITLPKSFISYTYEGRRYPLYGSAKGMFLRYFVKAGGLIPPDLDPAERLLLLRQYSEGARFRDPSSKLLSDARLNTKSLSRDAG